MTDTETHPLVIYSSDRGENTGTPQAKCVFSISVEGEEQFNGRLRGFYDKLIELLKSHFAAGGTLAEHRLLDGDGLVSVTVTYTKQPDGTVKGIARTDPDYPHEYPHKSSNPREWTANFDRNPLDEA